MALTMNIQDAKSHLSALVAEAEAGQEVVIARAGRPVVRLVPVTPTTGRRLGIFATELSPASIAESTAPLTDSEIRLWSDEP